MNDTCHTYLILYVYGIYNILLNRSLINRNYLIETSIGDNMNCTLYLRYDKLCSKIDP